MSRNLSASKNNRLRTMKIAWTAALILLLSLPGWAASASKHHSTPSAPADPDYVFALATANRFLHAWQSDDLETGMVLLSDRVRHSQDPKKFERFFAGSTDRAFEVTRGPATPGRYRFGVVLVTVTGARVRRRFSEIVVVSSGKNDWVVDKLP